MVWWGGIYPSLFPHLFPVLKFLNSPAPPKTTGFSFCKLLLCWGGKWIFCQPDRPSLWSLSTLQPWGTCCLSHSPAPTIKAPYWKALSAALITPGFAQSCISHLGPHSAPATTQEASRATSGSLQGLCLPGYSVTALLSNSSPPPPPPLNAPAPVYPRPQPLPHLPSSSCFFHHTYI